VVSRIKIVRTVKLLRREIGLWRESDERTALVPTMGALHDGHISLVKLAKRKAERVVVSIFVNPAQFGPQEDLARYPRDEAGDVAKLAAAGTDLVWAPAVAEMYPDGFSTRVKPGSAALPLEGEFRPQHFEGVTTVCCKLFSQVTPDIAIFGEKDFQQLAVLRQMVGDLNLPLSLIAAPTRREKDGLAMSSRNAYLSADERKIAPALNRALAELAEKTRAGGDPKKLSAAATQALISAGFAKVDYIAVRDAETLAPVEVKSDRPRRALAAAWLGKTRLIDNVAV